MASAAAELFVKVSADIKGLVSGFKAVENAANDMGEAAQQAAKPMSSLGDIIKGTAAGDLLADGIRSAADAMVGLTTQSIKLAGELEQNKVAFTTMLGSADKADAMLRELASFAASTPFELRGLTDSTKKLLAFGFNAQSVIPIMNSVGNAVAAVGGGKETLDGVTLALGQIAAKGKVSAEEMNQLAERGIPAWKMLADGIGVSIPEAMKKAEKGSIDAGTAITALVNGMNQKFPGMMAKQSQTIMGALSNLRDSADAALTRIGQKLIETFNLTRLVQQMSAAISNLTAAFTSGGLLAVLDKAFGPTTKAAILGIAAALSGPMVASLAGVARSFVAATVAAAPFLAVGAAVAFAAYPIIKNWEGIRGTITALWDTAAQYTSAYYNRAVRVVNDLVRMFQAGFGFIGSSIRAVLGDELTNKLLGGVSRAASAFKGFAEVAATPLRAVVSVGSAAASNFAETWRGAMSMSRGFTSDLFRQAGGAARDFSKTLTADMLGLAKSSAAAADGAKKAAAGIKAKAQAAKEAAAAIKAAAAEVNKLGFEAFEGIAKAEAKLRRDLAAVAAEAAKQGPAFDEAGARAEAYARNLEAIEGAWGRTNQRAVDLRAALEAANKASTDGGAANAAAYRILAEGSSAFELAGAKAAVMGEEFNRTAEQAKQLEADLIKMLEAGIRPGNAMYDMAANRLAKMREELKQQPMALRDMVQAQNELVNSLRDVGGGLVEIAGFLGIQVPQAVRVAGAALVAGALTIVAMTIAVDGLTVAWGKFTESFMANPIGAALVVAGAVIVGIIAAVNAVREEGRKAAEEAAAALAKAQEEADRARAAIVSSVGDALKAAGKAFIDGAADWGNVARMKIREGVIQAVLDAVMAEQVMKGLADMFERVKEAAANPMSDAFKEAVANLAAGLETNLRALEPVFKRAGDVINTYLPAVGERIADEIKTTTSKVSKQAEDARISVNESHQASLLRQIERATNEATKQDLLAQLRVLQGRATANDLAKVRPAMGGYSLQPLPGMAMGGLVTGPTVARMGEGGRDEAVLPLNDRVFWSIAQGIAAAGASGAQVVINYNGNGKWTREDAQGLGRLLVSELRAMGIR